jgi:hypothetical protein
MTVRQFASSPQKNPYSSIMNKLAVGNSQFSYYKLPALQDKRIGKYPYIKKLNFSKDIFAEVINKKESNLTYFAF